MKDRLKKLFTCGDNGVAKPKPLSTKESSKESPLLLQDFLAATFTSDDEQAPPRDLMDDPVVHFDKSQYTSSSSCTCCLFSNKRSAVNFNIEPVLEFPMADLSDEKDNGYLPLPDPYGNARP